MVDTREIAETVGRARMAAELGVGLTAISKYVVAGHFPASWLFVMQGLCKEFDISCPSELFGMKPYGSDAGGDNPPDHQDADPEQPVSRIETMNTAAPVQQD